VHSRRSHLVLFGLILAALAGALILIVPGSPGQKKATLGLDLQGGLEVVLKAVPPKGHTLTSDDVGRSVDVMRKRIDKLGVSEPEIRRQGSDQIVVQLPGVHNASKAAQIIGETAQLQLYDLEPDLTGPSVQTNGLVTLPVAHVSLYNLLTSVEAKAKQGEPTAYYVFRNKRLVVDGGPFERRSDAEKRRNAVLAGGSSTADGSAGTTTKTPSPKPSLAPGEVRILPVPPKVTVVTCGSDAVVCPGQGSGGVVSPPTKGQTYYYLFKYDPPRIPEMTGTDLKLSGTRQDFDPNTNEPIVLLSFTSAGGKKFHKITREEWLRGKLQNSPQHFAIVLDGEIKSFPQIDYTNSTLSDGIDPVNGAQITGIASLQEAKDLAIVLQSGALPVSFEQVERTDVSATLGKDSLQEAKKAALIGLLVVALFLLFFYRFLGVVAVLGLGIYAAFLYAAILIFNVTLTLPGFAGLILTIGVAADANIVIFERIKEEVRSGKSVRAAIAAGYSRGFHTIVDANVVTCITALILFAVATAQVKGFALMLLIGTVISLVTAVGATRAMLGLLAGFRWFDSPRFMGTSGEGTRNWQRVDVNSRRRRRIWLSIATVLIGASIAALATKGLNLGIDFRGGTQVTFKTAQYTSLEKVRAQAAEIGQKHAVVQGRGSSQGSDRYKSFQIRTKSLSAAEQDKLTSDLQSRVGASSLGVQNVSSSFSRQIARGAILAILVSFALIALYISFRFQWRFAIPILRTLFNDILITLGVYSLSGREVTTATVAAVLTVLGYSIYDTIIVFDRIRENMPLMRRASFATIANVSLWETVRRSLATTFSTLLPVSCLLLFGGPTLKDFAFALFIGIGLGAVSTFFVATPFLTVLMERHPDYARRAETDVVDAGLIGIPPDRAEAAAAPEPEPAVVDSLVSPAPAPAADGKSAAQQKRERRRQRRRSRPHGRAR
jgi:SecD/SecF fusion protein